VALDIDLAYCAGLVDGEGYIGVKKTQPYKCQDRATPGYHARIGIKMVTEESIRFFAETVGGWYYTEKPSLPNGRPYFVYQATNKKAAEILESLLPYLKVKQEQAQTVLSLRALQADRFKHKTKIIGQRRFPNKYGVERMVDTKCLSDEYVALCDEFWLRCKYLNRVGAAALEDAGGQSN
jgi:hypothetical protein